MENLPSTAVVQQTSYFDVYGHILSVQLNISLWTESFFFYFSSSRFWNHLISGEGAEGGEWKGGKWGGGELEIFLLL